MVRLIERIYKKLLRTTYVFFHRGSFGRYGKNTFIISPLKIDGADNIYIGDNVMVEYKSWLAAVPLCGGEAKLEIGEGSSIGHFNHIYATESITIERNVLTADKVYISDNIHSYEDVNLPVIQQPIKQCKPVVIGEGSWLGENVCILGASVGKHCVIGANAVVTNDIPDYSVAVGVPARVVKRYNFELREWTKE